MPKPNRGVMLFLLWLAVARVGLSQEESPHSASRPGVRADAGLAEGRKSYEAHCAMCHGLDGRGGEHAPGIANSRAVQGESDRKLVQTIREGIPSAGMPSFRRLPNSEIAALAKYLRSLNGVTGIERLKGNPLRGESLFFGKARCGDCHMLGGKGGFIGADLSDFALAHSPQEIREAIVHPDKKLLPGQQVVRVETVAGKQFEGLVRNEDNFSLQLQGTDGAFRFLMKSQIAKMERLERSLMPSDYGTQLSPAELDDLVSYLARYGRQAETPPGASEVPARRAQRGRSATADSIGNRAYN